MRTCLLFALALTLTAALAAAVANPIPRVPVEQYKLSNGLTVFLLEDHSLPLVSVNVNYMVGSKNEKPGKTGFAHLFEHMMFQGSKHYNDDYFKPLQDVGCQVNGGTNTDRTRYWELAPAAYLERVLWMEADRMGFLLDAMTQERLNNQVSVVQNERRQNYENRPYGTLREKVAALAYPTNHPYSWTTIGSIADLQSSTIDDVKDFFRSYYTPNNASLCIVGDFKKDEAKALVQKYFGDIPPGPPVTKLAEWTPRLSGQVELAMQDRVQLPRTTLFWHTPKRFSADEAALTAFGQILGGGKTSRLYKVLTYEKQLAQDAFAGNSALEISGQFQIVLTPKPGHTLKEVEAAALAVLEDALKNGVTAEELARYQNSLVSDSLRAMQNIGGFGGIADLVNEYYHYLGQPDMFREDLQRSLDLTPESVTAAARKYLGADRLVARVTPSVGLAADGKGAATEAERSTLPGPGTEAAFQLPARQHFQLANGLDVVLVEQHKLPLVTMALIVKSGTSADPAGRPGLAQLTTTLLQEGAGGRTSLQFADSLERLGASLRVNAGLDSIVASLNATKETLPEALSLFGDAVMKPDFPAAELERQRKSLLVRLMQMKDQPQFLAQTAFQGVVFAGHPYGQPAIGTPESLQAVTLDDIKTFWKSHFVPANAVLIVAGDMTRAELEGAMAANLAQWKGGARPALALKAQPQPAARRIYIVDKPGAAQSMVMAGFVGVSRLDPDVPAIDVMNTVFGGSFMSRLNMNLREQKGFTYGARSGFRYGLLPGAFSMAAPVQTKVTAETVTEMVSELEGIVGNRPVTPQELAYAKGTLVNGYAKNFSQLEQIVAEIADVTPYGLPDAELEAYPGKINALTCEQVAAAAKKHMLPGNVVVVVAGDAAAIRPALEKLNLGPVVLVDMYGHPLAAQ